MFVNAAGGTPIDDSTATVSNFNATGANFLIVSTSTTDGFPSCAITSTPVNVWHPLTMHTNFTYTARHQFFYAYGAAVSSAMTITCSANATGPALSVAAYSGVDASADPFDQESGDGRDQVANLGAIAIVTPSVAGELVVSGLVRGTVGNVDLESALPILTNVTASTNWGNNLAATIAPTTAAVSNTWSTLFGTIRGATSIATFRAGNGVPTPVMAFSQQPTNTVSGQPITPAVAVQINPAAANSLTLSVNSGQCTIVPSPATVTANAGGLATFSGVMAGNTGGSCTLRVHNNTNSAVTDVISNTFDITTPITPTLAFTVPPSNVIAGQTMMPAVQVTSSQSTFAGAVSLALNGCGASIMSGGMATAAAGVATFSSIVLSGTGTGCVFTASAENHAPVNSTTFNVNAPAVPTMVFTTPPLNVQAMPGMAVPFVPPIQVTLTPGAANQIQLSVASGNCTLAPTGNLTVTATAQGVATFTGVTVAAAAVPVTCTLLAHNLTNSAVMDIVSNPFDVVIPPPPGVFVQNVIGGGILP
jgi:hypothetical protein